MVNRKRVARIAARWTTELVVVFVMHQRRALSEGLLPLMGQDPALFYEPDPERPGALRLRPQHTWYETTRRRLGELARCTTALGDSALVALGAATDSDRPPLSTEGC